MEQRQGTFETNIYILQIFADIPATPSGRGDPYLFQGDQDALQKLLRDGYLWNLLN